MTPPGRCGWRMERGGQAGGAGDGTRRPAVWLPICIAACAQARPDGRLTNGATWPTANASTSAVCPAPCDRSSLSDPRPRALCRECSFGATAARWRATRASVAALVTGAWPPSSPSPPHCGGGASSARGAEFGGGGGVPDAPTPPLVVPRRLVLLQSAPGCRSAAGGEWQRERGGAGEPLRHGARVRCGASGSGGSRERTSRYGGAGDGCRDGRGCSAARRGAPRPEST